MKKTSQRSLLFRQNVGRTEEEWAHFLDGYRQALSLRLASTSGRGGRGWDEGLPRPCGLLAANDTTADIVLRVLKNMRIKVPEEIAVVGIDNDPLVCENTVPTLTSIAPDFERSGYIAAEMLDARMKGGAVGNELRTFAAMHVIHRGSTRILKRKDDAIKNALEFIREKASDGILPIGTDSNLQSVA